MPIFRKKVVEKAEAIFAIEADTKEQSDEVFNKFFNEDGYGDVSYDDYRMHMNESLHEKIEDLPSALNKSIYEDGVDKKIISPHTFYLVANDYEPRYDLYLCYEENDKKIQKAILSATMDTVLEHLRFANEEYILRPSCPKSAQVIIEARKRNTTIICYDMTRRNKNG